MKNKIMVGHFLALFSVLIWGTTFITSKILLSSLNPFSILVYRFLLGYIVLLIIHPKFQEKIIFKDEILFFFAGVSGVTLYMLSENLALSFSTASNVGLLVSAAPLFVALFIFLFSKDEKIHINFFAGFLIAFFGIFLIMFNGQMNLKLNPLGDFLALFAAFIWGLYNLFFKKLSLKDYNIYLLIRKIFFYSLVSMIPLFFVFDFNVKGLFHFDVFLNLCFLGIFASAMCYVTWSKACIYLGNIKAAAYLYLLPFVTIITAFIFLDEKIGLLSLFGCIFILIGLYVSDRR